MTHKAWPGVLDDLFGGESVADRANARERVRIAAQIAAAIGDIDSSVNTLRTIDDRHRVNVDGVRNRVNNLLDHLVELQQELNEQHSSDGRPLVIKGAHGVYR